MYIHPTMLLPTALSLPTSLSTLYNVFLSSVLFHCVYVLMSPPLFRYVGTNLFSPHNFIRQSNVLMSPPLLRCVGTSLFSPHNFVRATYSCRLHCCAGWHEFVFTPQLYKSNVLTSPPLFSIMFAFTTQLHWSSRRVLTHPCCAVVGTVLATPPSLQSTDL
jgi:hypothetical protein